MGLIKWVLSNPVVTMGLLFYALFVGKYYNKGRPNMKKRKTIKSLLGKNKVVYVQLTTKPIAEVFFALAKYEGFALSEEVAKTGVREYGYVKLNEDMTITYPGYHSWAGAMRFYATKVENGKKVVKIDFEEML